MSSTESAAAVAVRPMDRLEALCDELSELAGQRNVIDGRIVEIVAEIDRDGLCGMTGARSVAAFVAWKLGTSLANAHTIADVASRVEEFPRCTDELRAGRLSLDQVGIIAQRGGPGSDAHYAQLASVATVSQLGKAIKLEPRPTPDPRTEPVPAVTKTSSDEHVTRYRITLSHHDAAKFDAAVQSHKEALIAEHQADHDARGDDVGYGRDAQDDGDGERGGTGERPPFPTKGQAFLRLVQSGWDAEVAARPHGQHTTVIVHLDVEQRIAALHLGPVLPDAERRYLTCDATCEVWFQRGGQVIGAGRTTRTISRRLRRALEHRHPTCAVPGCGATRGLHAHHIKHWEDGGETELDNLVLLCPYHHRLHHRGGITITGPAPDITVTDSDGRQLGAGSLARPPNHPPPAVPPYKGPTGEHADWWWYDPYEPPPPTTNN